MKTMKKALALILALAIVMSLGITAFAEQSSYSITIKNDTADGNGSIAGRSFEAFKVFDVKYAGMPGEAGKDTPHTYYVAHGFSDFEFDHDGDGSLVDDPPKTAPISGEKLIEWVAGNSDNSAELNRFAVEAYKHISGKGNQYKFSDVAMLDSSTGKLTDEIVTIDVDETGNKAEGSEFDMYGGPGYYLIYMYTPTKEPVPLSSLILSTTNPNIVVNAKIQTPTLTKSIMDNGEAVEHITAQVGEEITYRLETKVPNMTAFSRYKMDFFDSMTGGLSLMDVSNFKVTVNGTEVEVIEVDTSENGNVDEYNDSTSGVWVDIMYDNWFDLEFKDLKQPLNKKDGTGTVTATADNPLVIEYKAKVNKNAVNTNFERNTATLWYSNNPINPDSYSTTPKQHTRVFDFELLVKKLNKENEALKDAEFRLFKNSGGAVNGVPESRTYYNYVPDPTDGTADKVVWGSAGNATTLCTDQNGNLSYKVILSDSSGTQTHYYPDSFKGLEAGTYYLEEVKAPAGYHLLKNPIRIDIKETKTQGDSPVFNGYEFIIYSTLEENKGQMEYVKDEMQPSPVVIDNDTEKNTTNIAHVVTVLNTSGTELPSTGGIGTTIFYTVGAVMMAGALVLLITKKKMSVN